MGLEQRTLPTDCRLIEEHDVLGNEPLPEGSLALLSHGAALEELVLRIYDAEEEDASVVTRLTAGIRCDP